MKLSEKGESRLYNSKNVFYDDDIEGDVVALYELSEVWEFEPDDFQGAVVLTVEEAKAVAVTMFALHKFCQTFLSGVNDNFLIKASKVNHVLDKRIEQAEKENEAK